MRYPVAVQKPQPTEPNERRSNIQRTIMDCLILAGELPSELILLSNSQQLLQHEGHRHYLRFHGKLGSFSWKSSQGVKIKSSIVVPTYYRVMPSVCTSLPTMQHLSGRWRWAVIELVRVGRAPDVWKVGKTRFLRRGSHSAGCWPRIWCGLWWRDKKHEGNEHLATPRGPSR